MLVLTVLSADPNAAGFQAYKKADYAAALPLFQKATDADPKNHWAWLNRARTLAALNKGADPDDYCAYEKNWVFLALDSLERAVQLDPSKVLAKLGEPDVGTDLLKKRPEFQRWLVAISAERDTDAQLKKLLLANPTWHSAGQGAIPKMLTLEAAGKTWAVKNKQVEVTLEGKKLVLKPEVRPWAFNEGKMQFRTLLLQGDATWQLGSVLADCD